MERQFNLLIVTRQNILRSIQELSLEQINYISENFNNSIGWQLTHILVTQQLLHYKLSGNSLLITEKLADDYRKGSSGKKQLDKESWDIIKTQFISLPQKLITDYKKELFKEYSTYTTSYNVTLNNIDDAIVFNNIHEAMHLGTINAMIKLL